MTSTTVRTGSRPRRALAGLVVRLARLLGRLADRLAPPREVRVHLTVDTGDFERAMERARAMLAGYDVRTYEDPTGVDLSAPDSSMMGHLG